MDSAAAEFPLMQRTPLPLLPSLESHSEHTEGSWCVFNEVRHAEPNHHLVTGAQRVDVLSL